MFNTEALVAIRWRTGLNQLELAQRARISQGHLSRIERGVTTPRPPTVRKLADALGVPIDALLTTEAAA